jgi:hypothetical protein
VIDSLEHDHLKGKFVDINRCAASTFGSRRRFMEKIGKKTIDEEGYIGERLDREA